MSSLLRSFKRRQKDGGSNELPFAEQKLPTGRVVSEPVKGMFVSFPILGWIAVRDRDQTPLVMLALALLESDKEDEGLKGMLELELPLYADTEAATVAMLERYGWQGTVWAPGDPPPFDNPELVEQLTGLLSKTSPRLRATFVFAADPGTGSALAQPVEVMRARGRFLMPPLERPSEPPHPERLEVLRSIVRDRRSFYSIG